jgi:arabinose-5-phosphate isomerase
MRDFDSDDFAKFHPGGALGKKLLLKVSDIYPNNEKPEVHPSSTLKEIILEISSKRLGVTAVTNNNEIVGIVTDGDLRRMLQQTDNITDLFAKDIMSENPKTIGKDELAVKALHIMQEKNITQLLVVEDKEYFGVIHLHDLIKEGIL